MCQLDHAGDFGRNREPFQDLQVSFAGAQNRLIAGNKIQVVAVDGKGADINLIQLWHRENFFEGNRGTVRIGTVKDVQLSGHGAEHIKTFFRFIIDDVMRASADFVEKLGKAKLSVLFFKDEDAVVFGVICKINGAVPCDGVPAVDLIGHHIPVGKWSIRRFRGQNLIVIAVHQKIIVTDFGNLRGDT